MTSASVRVVALFPTTTAEAAAQAAAAARTAVSTVQSLQAVLDGAGVSMTAEVGATVSVATSGGVALPSAALVPADSSALSSFTLWYSVVYDFFYQGEMLPTRRWLGGVPAFLVSVWALPIWVLLGLVCVCLPYLLFQKHLLPHCPGKWVGRLYFVPCLPCTIYGNKKTFKGRWWAYVDDGEPAVILGQAPLFQSQLRELETLKVQGIVNLCDEYKGMPREYKKLGMSLLWLKTVDHLEPTVEAMRTAVSFIEHHRKRGASVYIHCKSGRGRSAAIAMAWLMQIKQMRPLEANQHLLRVRKVRDKLFLQKNVIQFHEDLKANQDGAGDEGATGGRPAADSAGVSGRTMSFATPWRRSSLQAGREVLHGKDKGSKLYGTFRSLGTAVGGIAEGGFGMDDAPPDWGDEGGVWEINVAPLPPAVPTSLPASSQHELDQYTRQQQQYMAAMPAASRGASSGGVFGLGAGLGGTFGRAFAPIPGCDGPHAKRPFDVTETGHRSDEGRKISLVSTNL